jgi:glycogen debranching enzyme
MDMMYDEADAAFYDLHEPGSRRLRTRTPTIFFPLALDSVSDACANAVLQRHFSRYAEFDMPYPLPSVAPDDSSFHPGESPFIWRGPTWAFPNWFLYHAFKRHGFDAQAQYLKNALAAAIKQSGFREYYNPYSGEGYGANDFTWSGLLIDMD